MEQLDQLKHDLKERAEGMSEWLATGSATDYSEYTEQCGRIQELLGVVEDIENIIKGRETDNTVEVNDD